MIIIYKLNSTNIDECIVHLIIPDKYALIQVDNELYIDVSFPPVINIASNVGWFACPEQHIPSLRYDEDEFLLPQTVGELNLHYDWPEGFTPLPGTGIPEKIEHIENFLTKMFPTRGI